MPQDLKPLTALRFAAAAWVVAFSYWPQLAGAHAPALVSKGYLGVDLFFVLSGFILSHVYLPGFGQGRFRYGGFLWARVARIYPLHIAIMAGLGLLGVAAALAHVPFRTELINWPAFPANLLLVHAWGAAPQAAWNHPSWSISAEWFAYLSFPAFAWAAWRLKDRPNAAVVGALIVLFCLSALFERFAGFPLQQATFRWGALRIVPCFAYGSAIYLLWRSGAIASRLQATACSIAFAGLIVVLGCIGAPDPSLIAAFGGLILSLASLTSTGSRLLSNPVGVYLGEVSYAVYMVCFPWVLIWTKALQRLQGTDQFPLPLWLGLVFGVVPAAMVAHHLVERPARTALRRWAEKGFPRPLRPTPPRPA